MSQASLSFAAASEPDADNKTLLWPDGTRYVGGVKDGKRSGKGTIFWQNGTRFVGNFANDQRNGPGTMILPDGTVYNGYFSDDVLVDPPAVQSEKDVASTSNDVKSKPSPLDMDTNTPNIADNLPLSSIQQPEIADQQADKKAVQMAEQKANANVSRVPDTVAATVSAPLSAPASDTETQARSDNQQSTNATNEVPPAKNEPALATKQTSRPSDEVPLNFDANTLTVDVRREVEATIDLWAAAWSEQNVNQYLSYYAADFVVPGKQSRSQWEAVRRTRLTKPKSIKISIAYEQIEMTEPHSITIQFNETCRSNLYRDSTRKQMTLKKSGPSWMIQTEKSL